MQLLYSIDMSRMSTVKRLGKNTGIPCFLTNSTDMFRVLIAVKRLGENTWNLVIPVTN